MALATIRHIYRIDLTDPKNELPLALIIRSYLTYTSAQETGLVFSKVVNNQVAVGRSGSGGVGWRYGGVKKLENGENGNPSLWWDEIC